MKTKPTVSLTLLQAVANKLSRLLKLGNVDENVDDNENDNVDESLNVDENLNENHNENKNYEEPKEPESQQHDKWRQTVEDYVRETLSDPDLNVVGMARTLGLSRTALFAQMREAYGCTPAQYIQQQRMMHAQRLMQQGVRPREVAFSCGYSDPKYFGKVYKKVYGMLPTEYYASVNGNINDDENLNVNENDNENDNNSTTQ